MVVDAQDGSSIIIVVSLDDGGNVQSAHGAVVDHLIEELTGVGRRRGGIEVPPQRGDAADAVGSHALLTGEAVVERLADEQSHLIDRAP